MNIVHEYYDNMADISDTTRNAVESLESTRKDVRKALAAINKLKKQGDTTISFVSNVTTNDVHRNLLFLDLLINQTFGLIQTPDFQELLELTNWSINEEEF